MHRGYRRAYVRVTIIRCCKIVVIEGLSKCMSFLQKNRSIDWNAVTSKASFNFLHVPVLTLSFQWWILESFKAFFCFFFQLARILPEILNWFSTPLLGLPFSSSFNAFYFTLKVTSWCFLFVTIFVASATNNRIQTILRISKHSNIMAFELKHLNLLQQIIEGWQN